MASRQIANMHLFLEMKEKFPELPEDLIRRYVTKHSEDHEMCLQLLNQENRTHLHSSQPFADIPLSDHLSAIHRNKGISATAKGDGRETKPPNRIPYGQSIVLTTQPRFHHLPHHHAKAHQPSFTASVNGHHFGSSFGISHFLGRELKVSKSGEDPVGETNKSLSASSRNYPTSSQARVHPKQLCRDHTESTPDPKQICLDHTESSSQAKAQESGGTATSLAQFRSGSECSLVASPPISQMKRHAVKLSIIPVSPHQYYDAHHYPITAASRSSVAGKHTTSVNLQLRCPSSDQHPIEIMTSPINKDSTSDMNDFDSHVQISISSMGASFTARRLQKSPVSQFHPTSLTVSPVSQFHPTSLTVCPVSQFHPTSLTVSPVSQFHPTSLTVSPVSQFHPTSLTVSPMIQHSSKPPKRPDFLNIPSTNIPSLRSKQTVSAETRQPREISSFRLKSFVQHSEGRSGIPTGQEPVTPESDWSHFVPSPYQEENISIPNWPISDRKHISSRVAPEYASRSAERIANEELTYIQVLLEHQRARMQMLREELSHEKEVRTKLRVEVSSMEQALSQRRLKKSTFSQVEQLQKLREENRNLRVECNCLLMEVDLCNAGQVSLGMTDEDFYSNIFTGPTGPIPPVGQEEEQAGFPFLQTTGKIETSKIEFPMMPDSSNEEDEGDDDDDDDDEKNKWRCKKCTFANHPAMKKCEICDLPRNTSYIDCASNYCHGADSGFVPSPEERANMLSRRAIGSVQICVTQNVPSSSSKGLKLQLTHRVHR